MTTGESSNSTDVVLVDSATELVTDDPLRPFVAAWLLGFKSEHTVRNYRKDLADWRAFCGDHGLDPLLARRAHVDAWARLLEASGLKGPVLPNVSPAANWTVVPGQRCASESRGPVMPRIPVAKPNALTCGNALPCG